MTNQIDHVNHTAFNSPENAQSNKASAGLFGAEDSALAMIPQVIRQGRILEIGVGSGRLVPVLSDAAAMYVGTDYAARAVELCRAAHPTLAFEEVDARDMQGFADQSFDLVVFSYNGIDYVDHAGRQAILSEVARLLAVGGYFLFSFHNRDFHKLESSLTPKDVPMWKKVLFFWEAAKRAKIRERKKDLADMTCETPEYAILNDSGMNFAVLTYYADLASQCRLVRSQMLEPLAGFAKDGTRVELETSFTQDSMIHLLCQRFD